MAVITPITGRYFNESMEDANFKKLVARLNMPNKDLMKYTSKLQKTASELSHCQNCKNVLECNHEVGGYIYYPTANGNNLIFDYIPCKYQKKLEKDLYYKNFMLGNIGWDCLNPYCAGRYSSTDPLFRVK